MPGHVPHGDAETDGSRPIATPDVTELVRQVEDLQHQVETLEQAATSRQRVGFVCGVLAERYGLSPEIAWTLLRRLSQTTNIKVRDIARVMHADLDGGVRPADAEIAERLNSQVEGTVPLLSTLPPSEHLP